MYQQRHAHDEARYNQRQSPSKPIDQPGIDDSAPNLQRALDTPNHQRGLPFNAETHEDGWQVVLHGCVTTHLCHELQ